MAEHTVTPYEVSAVRKHARGKEKAELLLLASVGKDEPVDLLDAIEANITTVDPVRVGDDTKTVSCVLVERDGNFVDMVIVADVAGEVEAVHDTTQEGVPLVFTKGSEHITRYQSVCSLWRRPEDVRGLLAVHSPWARGGSRRHVQTLIQRSLDAASAKAKVDADPVVPQKALERILQQATTSKVIYRRQTGITSTFSDQDASAPAEMDLVVRGSDSIPFRDALAAAVRHGHDRERLFTVRVRDESTDNYRQVTFDDVELEVRTPGGTRRYSVTRDTIPTMGFNLTTEANEIYYRLPAGDASSWSRELLNGLGPHVRRVIEETALDASWLG